MRKVTVVQRWLGRYALRHPSPVLASRYTELVSTATGQVVEVGCATGFLFDYYPEHIGHLVAVEPRADYRDAAHEAARRMRFPVKVVDTGPAGTLPLATGSADVVVCCEVLCSVADLALMLHEIRRVLRPGGELRVYEHVAAHNRLGRLAQRILDRLLWPRMLDGCHLSRDISRFIDSAGFEWVQQRRVWFARFPFMIPSGPHILGAARPISTVIGDQTRRP